MSVSPKQAVYSALSSWIMVQSWIMVKSGCQLAQRLWEHTWLTVTFFYPSLSFSQFQYSPEQISTSTVDAVLVSFPSYLENRFSILNFVSESFFSLQRLDLNNVLSPCFKCLLHHYSNVCVYRHSTPAATAAATAAGFPYGSSHAAQHAGHDGNELWGTNAPWSHAYAGVYEF